MDDGTEDEEAEMAAMNEEQPAAAEAGDYTLDSTEDEDGAEPSTIAQSVEWGAIKKVCDLILSARILM